MRVLVVDDDAETLEVVARAGHTVVSARSAAEATTALAREEPDVLVLDVMLEQASGIELCARLRSQGLTLPVLFLSARGTVNARVEGLDAGGDDYLAKPFAIRELVARVRALGRRRRPARARRLEMGALTVDFDARHASVQGAEVPVTRREWEILRVLVAAEGGVVTFDEILERAWGDVSPGARASLEVIVARIRKKLVIPGTRPLIRTVRGEGYALETRQ